MSSIRFSSRIEFEASFVRKDTCRYYILVVLYLMLYDIIVAGKMIFPFKDFYD